MKINGRTLTHQLLESFSGLYVKIIFFDNSKVEGTLQLGNGYFYEPKKYYVNDTCFRLSHIKLIEVDDKYLLNNI